MKLFNNITLLLLITPLFLMASPIKKHEKSKTISKNYKVNKNATVYIKNKYGNLNVTTWNKNTVEIDVKITVKGKDLEDVQDRLDAINVKFEASASLVEARTIIESFNSGRSWWNKNNNLSYQINYYVKMPITNNIDLNNKYGNIELENVTGKANLKCAYGSINVDRLENENNTINLDYSDHSEISYIKAGSINADYSKITLDEAESLKVSCDYTQVKIGTIKTLDFKSDYGGISVKDVRSVKGNSDYAAMRFGTVRESLKINTDYGSLRIKDLAKGFDQVTINGSYAGIKIGTSSNNSFNFKVDVSYAGFSYPKNYVETTKSIKKETKKYYEGTFGKTNSGSQISIRSDYGSVSLKVND